MSVTTVVTTEETTFVVTHAEIDHIHDDRYYTEAEIDALIGSFTPADIANWNTAFGWGDHALAGYLTAITISPTLTTDHSYSGPTSTDTVGEDVVFGDFLYKKVSDGKWYKAKANAVTTVPCMRMAVATASAGNTCLLLCPGGIARDDSWSWTTDGTVIELWLSASVSGTLTEVIDSSSGAFGQVVGTPLASNQIELCPSLNIARF